MLMAILTSTLLTRLQQNRKPRHHWQHKTFQPLSNTTSKSSPTSPNSLSLTLLYVPIVSTQVSAACFLSWIHQPVTIYLAISLLPALADKMLSTSLSRLTCFSISGNSIPSSSLLFLLASACRLRQNIPATVTIARTTAPPTAQPTAAPIVWPFVKPPLSLITPETCRRHSYKHFSTGQTRKGYLRQGRHRGG